MNHPTYSNKVYEAYQEAKKESQRVTRGMNWKLARCLHYLKEGDKYKIILQGGKDTWGEFLALPEIAVSRAKSFRLTRLYGKYVVELGRKEHELEKLDSFILMKLASLVTKKNFESWASKLASFAPKEQDKRDSLLRMIKYGDADPASCRHQWRAIPMRRCVKCGKKETAS